MYKNLIYFYKKTFIPRNYRIRTLTIITRAQSVLLEISNSKSSVLLNTCRKMSIAYIPTVIINCWTPVQRHTAITRNSITVELLLSDYDNRNENRYRIDGSLAVSFSFPGELCGECIIFGIQQRIISRPGSIYRRCPAICIAF